MVTHKQFPNHRIFETDIGGRPFTVEVGKVAELANAEAICRYGDTVVLCTVTASPLPKVGFDYFPLTIEVEERMFAVGRIPGSFNRREGRPSERGILISRLIDRPMRPLFDDELRNDVVVTNTILANDFDNPVEIVAAIGSSLVVAYSDVPWGGPTATTNVCYLDGRYIINPSQDERNACACFVTIASTHEKVVMIETEAKEIPEDILLECIRLAHETNIKVVEFINEIVAVIGKPKFTFEKAAVNHELLDDLMAYGMDQIEFALDTDDKNLRDERITAAHVDFQEKFGEKYPDFDDHIEVCLYKMQKKVVKKWLLAGKRVDGRGMDEIRPLAAEVGVLPRVHGSGLFTRGQTQVLSVCTLNTLSAAQKLDTVYDETEKRYMHHYNFPAFSTGEAKPARSTSRREIGHGSLAEKALLPVIPSVEEFPYAIRVVSEVVSSNGSTSQGSICGSTLALMDAGVPIKRPVAGISCGLISDQETGVWRTFTDIQGVEDFHGEMDFKVEDRPGEDPRGHRRRRQDHPEDLRRHRRQDRHRGRRQRVHLRGGHRGRAGREEDDRRHLLRARGGQAVLRQGRAHPAHRRVRGAGPRQGRPGAHLQAGEPPRGKGRGRAEHRRYDLGQGHRDRREGPRQPEPPRRSARDERRNRRLCASPQEKVRISKNSRRPAAVFFLHPLKNRAREGGLCRLYFLSRWNRPRLLLAVAASLCPASSLRGVWDTASSVLYAWRTSSSVVVASTSRTMASSSGSS